MGLILLQPALPRALPDKNLPEQIKGETPCLWQCQKVGPDDPEVPPNLVFYDSTIL